MKNAISCFTRLENNLRSHIFSSSMTPNIYPAYYENIFPFLCPCVMVNAGIQGLLLSLKWSVLKGHCCSCNVTSAYWVREVLVPALLLNVLKPQSPFSHLPNIQLRGDPSKTITIIKSTFPKVSVTQF